MFQQQQQHQNEKKKLKINNNNWYFKCLEQEIEKCSTKNDYQSIFEEMLFIGRYVMLQRRKKNLKQYYMQRNVMEEYEKKMTKNECKQFA